MSCSECGANTFEPHKHDCTRYLREIQLEVKRRHLRELEVEFKRLIVQAELIEEVEAMLDGTCDLKRMFQGGSSNGFVSRIQMLENQIQNGFFKTLRLLTRALINEWKQAQVINETRVSTLKKLEANLENASVLIKEIQVAEESL